MDKTKGEYSADDAPRARLVGKRSNQQFDDDVTALVVRGSIGTANNDPIDADSVVINDTLSADTAASNLPNDESLEPGSILRERFEIVSLVHTGGMGHVYKTIDRRRLQAGSKQIHVAIKMMRRSISDQVDARLALEREASRAQRLSHPNIVNIFDFDEHDGQFFLVAEWLEGESVNALMRRTSGRPLAQQFAWQVIRGIAAGLQHAHSNNVVHADINPSNVLITDTQEVKLLDFGAAKDDSEPEVGSEDSPIWATHTYASPEVLSGSQPTFADDIFSFGCVAYRLLTGRHPFAGMRSLDAKQKSINVQPIPGLPVAQWRVLEASLSFDRLDRPVSADAFLTDAAGAMRRRTRQKTTRLSLALWPAAMGVLVAILLTAGLTWFGTRDSLNNTATGPMVSDTIQDVVEDTPTIVEPAEWELLLSNAYLAMQDERFFEPLEDNANTLFKQVLELDAANSDALTGLRRISERYSQHAYAALRDGEPAQVLSALDLASQADSENPAIIIVKDLLVAQANSDLLNARLAAAEGDVTRASGLLARLEQYGLVDAEGINSVKRQLAGVEQDREFDDRLAIANSAIAEGRLVAPAGDNAFEILFELQQTHTDNEDVLASKERLVDRLLNRAAFAIAVNQYSEASDLLNAAAGLGVSRVEIELAQTTLQEAMAKSEKEALQAALAFVEIEEIAPERTTTDPSPNQLTSLAPAVPVVSTGDRVPESRDPRTVRLSELTIEKYVAPKFPRRAVVGEISGAVDLQFNVNSDGTTDSIKVISAEPADLFVTSARNAVLQWRFKEQETEVQSRVKLRFDWEAEKKSRR